MKKILLFITIILSLFSSLQYTYANDIVKFFDDIFGSSSSSSSSSSSYSTFDSSDASIPYNGDYGLEAGIEQAKLEDVYTTGKASEHIQLIIVYLLKFVAFASIIIIILAGFYILTAGTDEEKISKGKKIIIYVILGIIVIFLAGPITYFILDMFEAGV